MDTSLEYVDMCNCKEIKHLYWEICEKDPETDKNFWGYYSLGETWLPRQDQLQKALGWDSYELIYSFNKFCRGDSGMYGERGFLTENGHNYSMEQLWLIFVMHELHNKVWNGEMWTK